jgi:hypothetical protein
MKKSKRTWKGWAVVFKNKEIRYVSESRRYRPVLPGESTGMADRDYSRVKVLIVEE